jgi:hypothetical protein
VATHYTADTEADVQIYAAGGAVTFIRPFSFNIATNTVNTGFIINDTVGLCTIPYKSGAGGVLVVNYHVEVPSLDSATSVVLALGDNNTVTTGAFNATFVTGAAIGQSAAGVLSPLMCYSGTTAVAPVRGVLPKQYTTSNAGGSATIYPDLQFILKVTTAPGTATTSGTIKGWLMLQTLNASVATF